jgi:hypothetical protein
MIDPITQYILEQDDEKLEKDVKKAEKMGSDLQKATDKGIKQMGAEKIEEKKCP